MMLHWSPVWMIAALMGHFGLRLTLYNRLNSLGWPRAWIKRIEVALLAETFVTPAVILWNHGPRIWHATTTAATTVMMPPLVTAYGLICLGLGAVFGILWLAWRPFIGLQQVSVQRHTTSLDVAELAECSLPLTRKCRVAQRIPGNQIFDLSVEQIELPVVGLPKDLTGYRIAHLSDIHLTGQVDPAYAATVVEQTMRWRPDLIALTGDIVDKSIGLSWLDGIFSQANAMDGCYFILGNHDTRVSDPDDVRSAMVSAGWHDLGGRCVDAHARNSTVMLVGNESPWFARPDDDAMTGGHHDFRVCLSHSPDQFDWCRHHGIELMLAGHTHGGQGRLPLAGPILSPSRHGSRWASGDFRRAPTTLHVSRGLGGVHLLRWRCPPELSLLTLRPG
ncbi:MAG: metallophosphoesterase [Planctomycetota bacterium]